MDRSAPRPPRGRCGAPRSDQYGFRAARAARSASLAVSPASVGRRGAAARREYRFAFRRGGLLRDSARCGADADRGNRPEKLYAEFLPTGDGRRAVGDTLRVRTDEVADELALVERLRAQNLYNRFHHLKTTASAEADAEMVFMLSSPKFSLSRTLQEGALTELREAHKDLSQDAPPETRVLLDRASVLKVAQRYADPDFGKGVVRLETTQPQLKENEAVIRTVTRAGLVPQLDLVARQLPENKVADFASQVRELGEAGKTEALAQLINVKLGEIVR